MTDTWLVDKLLESDTERVGESVDSVELETDTKQRSPVEVVEQQVCK